MPAKKSARSQPAAAAQPVQTTKQLQQQLAQAKEREAKPQESEAKLRQELDDVVTLFAEDGSVRCWGDVVTQNPWPAGR